MRPFGVPSVPNSQAWIAQFAPGPPPALTSNRYAKDYNEVKSVGNVSSDLTSGRRSAEVARFYAASSPAFVFNLARGRSPQRRAPRFRRMRGPSPAQYGQQRQLVVSFWTKYHYKLWRPETAIREGDLDGNAKTDIDLTFVPYILTPCFPSYPSNHGSGSTAPPRS